MDGAHLGAGQVAFFMARVLKTSLGRKSILRLTEDSKGHNEWDRKGGFLTLLRLFQVCGYQT